MTSKVYGIYMFILYLYAIMKADQHSGVMSGRKAAQVLHKNVERIQIVMSPSNVSQLSYL